MLGITKTFFVFFNGEREGGVLPSSGLHTIQKLQGLSRNYVRVKINKTQTNKVQYKKGPTKFLQLPTEDLLYLK